MAAFHSLDPSSMNDTSNHGSFSQALDNEFTLQSTRHVSGDETFSSGSDPFSKGGFDGQSLTIDTRFLDNSASQTQPDQRDPLRLRYPHSPPGSATLAPKQWPFDNHRPLQTEAFSHGQNLSNAYNHYGQMTPPDDKTDHPSDANLEPSPFQPLPSSVLAADQLRHNSDATEPESRPKPKRTRKNASRRAKANGSDSHDPNDMRRSKFLERNRVAASKCRQKKKEWTQNLEGKARELQTENNSLRLWLDSLRDEYMYLKTQVAEHRSCNNRAINEFLDDPKRDLLALNNPAARNLLENMHRHPIKQESEDEEHYSRGGSLSDEEDALEALLTDSINEATTD